MFSLFINLTNKKRFKKLSEKIQTQDRTIYNLVRKTEELEGIIAKGYTPVKVQEQLYLQSEVQLLKAQIGAIASEVAKINSRKKKK